MTVLDSSAVLAYLFEERGGGQVAELLDGAAMSSVNLSEVVQKLIGRQVDPEPVVTGLARAGLRIEPFEELDAVTAAAMYDRTKAHGLALADRACLALALRLGSPAATADKIWNKLRVGVQIHLIR